MRTLAFLAAASSACCVLGACYKRPQAVPGGSPLAAASSGAATADPKPANAAVTIFHLHKMLRKIGVERDTFTPIGGGAVEIKASFGFQDRGTQVPLAAAFRIGADGVPRSYESWGNTSRLSTIDERVDLEADGTYTSRRLGETPSRKKPQPPFVIASGYAPVLAQDLMLRAWVGRGRPATMTLVPDGKVSIESRGREGYTVEDKRVELEHVSVGGLVWGREDAWLDDTGKLVALATRDAEFDHFEAVREGFVAILPALAESAGADGVKWLSEVAQSAQGGPSGVVALVGGKLVDGTGRPGVPDAVVVYDAEKIVAAGPRGVVTPPEGATIVDITGKTVVPGLWDMHAHFQQVEHGAAYLAAGVTTVRDMGNVLEFVTGVRDAIDAGKGLGPRIIADGLVDGDGVRAAGTLTIKSVADIAPVLDRLKRAGCPEVKLYSSIDPRLVKTIAIEAHRRGLRVIGHVPEGMNVIEAIEAGYDGVSHSTYLFGPLFAPGERDKLSRSAARRRIIDAHFDAPPLSQVMRAFVAKKVVLDDTVALFDLFNHTDEENARREPGLAKMPRELKGMFEGAPADEAAERAAMFEQYLAFIRELHRRGVPIVAGTDISVPGHSLHRELELYVQAGFSPMEAIQAATIVPARAMRLDKEVGTIEIGKRPDLVVIDGDPLSDIHDIRKVATVVARGKTYDPKVLWRLIGFTP